MNCPVCHGKTDMREMGYVRGRHIWICRKCGQWLEEIVTLRTLPLHDKQLIQSLEVG